MGIFEYTTTYVGNIQQLKNALSASNGKLEKEALVHLIYFEQCYEVDKSMVFKVSINFGNRLTT